MTLEEAAFDAKRKAEAKEVIKVLGELLAELPMARIGAIIDSALIRAYVKDYSLYTIEDRDLLGALKDYFNYLKE